VWTANRYNKNKRAPSKPLQNKQKRAESKPAQKANVWTANRYKKQACRKQSGT
jgi:hypothetical protein